MEQRTLKIINHCWNIKISFYFESSGGQSFNMCLNVFSILD